MSHGNSSLHEIIKKENQEDGKYMDEYKQIFLVCTILNFLKVYELKQK